MRGRYWRDRSQRRRERCQLGSASGRAGHLMMRRNRRAVEQVWERRQALIWHRGLLRSRNLEWSRLLDGRGRGMSWLAMQSPLRPQNVLVLLLL